MQGISQRFRVLQEVWRNFSCFQRGFSFRDFEGSFKGFNELQGLSRELLRNRKAVSCSIKTYKWISEVSWGFNRAWKKSTVVAERIQIISKRFNGFQKASVEFKKSLQGS